MDVAHHSPSQDPFQILWNDFFSDVFQPDCDLFDSHQPSTTPVFDVSEFLNLPPTPVSSSICSSRVEPNPIAATQQSDKSNKQLKPRKRSGKRQKQLTKMYSVTMSFVDLVEDGYKWRKYGEKTIKNNPHPRHYYRCANAKCSVKKRVDRSRNDEMLVITTYEGRHTHDGEVQLLDCVGATTLGNMPIQQQQYVEQQQERGLNELEIRDDGLLEDILNPPMRVCRGAWEHNPINYSNVPREGYIKLKCNGAWWSTTKQGGIGFVARNSDSGVELIAGCGNIKHCRSSLVAEAGAIHKALEVARSRNWGAIQVETDSVQLVSIINKEEECPREIKGMASRMWQFFESFVSFEICLVSREANYVAHCIAKYGSEFLDDDSFVIWHN